MCEPMRIDTAIREWMALHDVDEIPDPPPEDLRLLATELWKRYV